MQYEITDKMRQVWTMHDNGAPPRLIAALLDTSVEGVELALRLREDAHRILSGDYTPLQRSEHVA